MLLPPLPLSHPISSRHRHTQAMNCGGNDHQHQHHQHQHHHHEHQHRHTLTRLTPDMPLPPSLPLSLAPPLLTPLPLSPTATYLLIHTVPPVLSCCCSFSIPLSSPLCLLLSLLFHPLPSFLLHFPSVFSSCLRSFSIPLPSRLSLLLSLLFHLLSSYILSLSSTLPASVLLPFPLCYYSAFSLSFTFPSIHSCLHFSIYLTVSPATPFMSSFLSLISFSFSSSSRHHITLICSFF